MAFLPGEIQKLNTWNGYGLKASASHDFRVSDIEIPEYPTFAMTHRSEYAGKPLFHYPFMGYAPAPWKVPLPASTAFIQMQEPLLRPAAKPHWRFTNRAP
jgi:hypothetical protein